MHQRGLSVFLILLFSFGGSLDSFAQRHHGAGGETPVAPTVCTTSEASGLAKFAAAVLAIFTLGAVRPDTNDESCSASSSPSSSDGASPGAGEKPKRSWFGRQWDNAKGYASGAMTKLKEAAFQATRTVVGEQGNFLTGASKAASSSLGKCYKSVKYILKKAGCISSSALKGESAWHAGFPNPKGRPQLEQAGYRQLNVSPSQAPKGAVIVYKKCSQNTSHHGHIEVKVDHNLYASDFESRFPTCPNAQATVWFKEGCV